MEAGGIEQQSKTLESPHKSVSRVSYCGALSKTAPNSRPLSQVVETHFDNDSTISAVTENELLNSPKLARIVSSWISLPPHIQESIISLVDAVLPLPKTSEHQFKPGVQTKGIRTDRFRGNSAGILGTTILKALRHTPELFGLQMDSDGWVNTVQLSGVVGQLTGTESIISFEKLVSIFSEIGLNDRVQFKHGFVRAAYGHSSDRFAPEEKTVPDQLLFHGTSAANWSMIECFGLSPAKRRFVQLTTDFDYANQIANSHSRSPIMLQVATAEAIALGVEFYSTDTHVWLATAVPATCLQVWLDDTFGLEEPLF